MPEGHASSLWAAGVLVVILSLLFGLARRRFGTLPCIYGPRVSKSKTPNDPLADCMVVIPARNEEATIGRAVRSLPRDTVIVVDDHSEDRTAKVARKAGAGVLPAPELPHLAIGKANACAAGALGLASRWVLFTDADTWFEPGFLNAAVGVAEANGLSLLSFYLDPEYGGWAERTLGPYARALAFSGLGLVNNPRALFTGQCLLARVDSYRFIGGHSAVLKSLIEDLQLTKLAERHRLKFATARAPGFGYARLYDGYAGVRDGIQRQAFRFMMINRLTGVVVIGSALLAALWLPALAWLVRDKQWIAAGSFALVPSLLLWPWYPSWRSALLAPLAVYWILPAMARGLIGAVLGRPAEWKGRKVRGL